MHIAMLRKGTETEGLVDECPASTPISFNCLTYLQIAKNLFFSQKFFKIVNKNYKVDELQFKDYKINK